MMAAVERGADVMRDSRRHRDQGQSDGRRHTDHISSGEQIPTRRGRRRSIAETARHAPPPPPPSPPPRPLPPPPPPPPPSSPPSFETWYAIFAKAHGMYYYCNASTRETSWDPPNDSRGVRVVRGQPLVYTNATTAVEAKDHTAFSYGIVSHCGAVKKRSRSAVRVSRDGSVRDGATSLRRSPTETSAADATPLRQAAVLRKNEKKSPLTGERFGTTTEAVHQGDETATSWTKTESDTRISLHHSPLTRQATALVVKQPSASQGTVGGEGGDSSDSPALSAAFEFSNAAQGARQGCVEKGHMNGVPSSEHKQPSPLCVRVPRKDLAGSDGPPSRRVCDHRVPDFLLRAESWLAQNEAEFDPCRASSSSRADSDSCPSACPMTHAKRTEAPLYDTSDATGRLRRKAAAEWAAGEARRDEDEQLTGKPKITNLGRGKRRSVDDLFLFQRTMEATRRRKQNEKEAMEESLLTGRPDTCPRSKLLVERRRRSGRGTDLSTSQRLHNEAWEQRRRLRDRQARLETAARDRANPELASSLRALPPNRGDVGERLYEQALRRREDALERERCAYMTPPGATFHPEIDSRSESMARRRRKDGWCLGGCRDPDRVGLVEEALLAEGVLYERRRQERQERQDQLDEFLRRGVRASAHSERLLREAERRGMKKERQRSGLGQGEESRVVGEAADGNVDEETSFTPNLEVLEISDKLLESRYGRDSVPSMAERAREREVERKERRKRLAERGEGKEGVVPRTSRHSSGARSPEDRYDPTSAICSSRRRGSDIYERSAEYARLKEERRNSQREALLAEEMSGCTFAPELPSRRTASGSRARATPPSSVSSSRKQIVRENSSSKSSSVTSSSRSDGGRDSEQRNHHSRTSESDSGGGAREGMRKGKGTRQGGGVTATKRAERLRSLPDGWAAFTTPEGRTYYFFSGTGLVQWERPVR